jgi:sulfur carrier protein
LPLPSIVAKIEQMKITLNGQEQTCDATTLAQLIEQLGMKQDRVAVELNRDIVPRTQWQETKLAEGDDLEIVHFVGGGSSSLRRRPAGCPEGVPPSAEKAPTPRQAAHERQSPAANRRHTKAQGVSRG